MPDIEARLMAALRDVHDPELPVSIVDMGLVIALRFEHPTALVTITYTAMACPAMDMIQDDIRRRLLAEPEVEQVLIQVVWDPIWSPERLSPSARIALRDLGIAV
jgi:metal-sulfur cluster biosynthetic enzyme